MAKYFQERYGNVTQFGAVSDKPYKGRWGEEPDQHAIAQVSYERPHEDPLFDTYRGSFVGDGGAYAKNPQQELLQYRPGKVTGAFADPSMKAHVGPLLGLVGDYASRQTGGMELPTPDSSLSKHSSKLVKKVRKMGADLPKNPSNPNSNRNNNYDFSPQKASQYQIDRKIASGTSRELSPEEVAVGRQHIRNLVRPSNFAPESVPPAQTEGFRGRPKEGVEHQGALFSSRQLAATQRKAGYSPAETERVTSAPKPPKPQPSADVSYHYEGDSSDNKRILAMHPEHGVVGMISLGRRSWSEQSGQGLGVDTRYLNKSAPSSMRSAVNETMSNVAHHQLGYTPQEGTYGATRARNAHLNQVPLRPGVWASNTEQIDSHLSRMLTPYTKPKASRARQPKQLDLGI